MTTATLEERVTRIESIDIPELYGKMNTLTASHSAKLRSIEDILSNIQTSINNLDTKIDNLDKGLNYKLDTMDKKIDDSIGGVRWLVMINFVITGIGVAFLTLVFSLGFGFFV